MNAVIQRDAARNELAVTLWQRMNDCALSGDDCGYMSARTELYCLFEKLSLKYASRYLSQPWLSPDDICQECRIAVLDTMDRWDPNRGEFPVCLYYSLQIRMREYLRGHELIKRPRTEWENHLRPAADSRARVNTGRIETISFNGARDTPFGGSEEFALDETLSELADPNNAYEPVVLSEAIRQAFGYLSEKDRESVILHFGFDGGGTRTYRAMAPLLGVSYQMASHRVNQALPIIAAVLEEAF